MKAKPICCPSCGKPYEGRPDPHKLVEHLALGWVQRAVLRTLMANFARQVPTSVLAERVYAGAADGGPDTAESGIRVHASRLRKVLAPYGLTIVGNSGAARYEGGAYRVDWLDAPAVSQALGREEFE